MSRPFVGVPRLLWALVVSILMLWSSPVWAEFPLPPSYPDCGLGGECPPDYSPNGDWELGSGFPDGVNVDAISPDERPLGSGSWVDRAWGVTTGRTDVLIAVMDSGIEWDTSQLRTKHFLNAGELPFPQNADGDELGTHDLNGDGVFNMEDWDEDPRLAPDLGGLPEGHADDLLDPSDLIAAFSDGVDDDGNGYVDDISGWDFFWNDNNPYDEVQSDGYSHGTKEARWSAADGGDGGDIGSCPNCMVLHLRVSDSFVGDVNNFALATLYATDMGALVVQEALGTINNTQLAEAAIDYAWNRGVTIIGSAADETAYHHNFPGANHHVVLVHSIRHDSSEVEWANTFFAYSNCTNFGPRLDLSVAAENCSSGATGRGAGIAGLMYSAALDALEAGTLDAPLTGNEAYQLMTHAVDDVAFTPIDDDPDRYPSKPGWDAWYGHGRLNASALVEAVAAGAIPPEADLLTPGWFDTYSLDDTETLSIYGIADASRADSFTWELAAAAGLDPEDDGFQVLATGSGTERMEGLLATVDLATLPGDPEARIEPYTSADTNVSKARKAHVHMVVLRLRVVDDLGRVGAMRKAFYVQRDPDLLPGLPTQVATGIEASPTLVDVDGDGIDDVVFLTSDGDLHVVDAALQSLPGWPQSFGLLDELDATHPDNHLAQPAYAGGEVDATQRHGAIATPAVADLDGDGAVEVVAASLNGELWVWHADGETADGWPFVLDESLVVGLNEPDHNNYDYGFFGAPALGDLDTDGDLEIVIGAMDSRVYAFHHDGSSVSGFPVELREDYQSGGGVESRGERVISSPALGDIDGDGFLEIAIGSNQKTTGTYGLGYVLSHDGLVEEGWPHHLFGAYTNALPFVGEGVPGSPTLCDVDGDGTLEVAMHTIADSGKLLSWNGETYARLARVANDFGGLSNTSEDSASLIMISSGAWGDLDQDGLWDYLIGSMGFAYAGGLLNDGYRNDHDHLLGGWSGQVQEGATGPGLPFLEGFPQIMEDLQFFLNPAILDLDGDGLPEAINGSAGHILHAFNHQGREPLGWPKDTGQWVLGSPAIGDADGDGYLEVWTATRDGHLFAWKTPAVAATAYRTWTSFHHDPRNTGNCHTELRSYPPLPEETGCDGCAGCESSVAPGLGAGRASRGATLALLGGMLWGLSLVARRRRSA